MVCTADEMMAGKGEEEEEEEGGVHVQGGQYFGTGSYVSSYHASIQTLFIQCSAVFSFLLNVAASSVCAASSPAFGHSTPAT